MEDVMYKYIICLIIILTTNLCLGEIIVVRDISDAVSLSENNDMPILLVFVGDSCVYCEKLKQDLKDNENLKKTLDNYIICFIDIDTHRDLMKEYRVKTIPDSRILKNNIEVTRMVGYNKSRFYNWINNIK